MDTIENVVYINLENRTDRRQQVETELLKVFPSEKIVRFNAIKHERGGIGCSMSHIGALEMAIENKWKNVLIVEDDLQWNDFEKGCDILSSLVKKRYDAIVLSGHEVSYNKQTYKLFNCCARTAYLVQNHYYETLLNNFKEGLARLQTNLMSQYRGDRYWNRIQVRDNWYIVIPAVCIQRPSFSDIENRIVDYSKRITSTKRIIIPNIIFNPK